MTDRHVFENLSDTTVALMRDCLRGLGYESGLEDVFWLPVPQRFLTDTQKKHADECGPYALAIVLGGSTLSLEFLVRAGKALHCSCVESASPALRTFALNQLSSLLTQIKN